MSYALQPHRSVALKKGDLRYHGPKYKEVDVALVVVSGSAPIAPPSSRSSRIHRLLNDGSMAAVTQGHARTSIIDPLGGSGPSARGRPGPCGCGCTCARRRRPERSPTGPAVAWRAPRSRLVGAAG